MDKTSKSLIEVIRTAGNQFGEINGFGPMGDDLARTCERAVAAKEYAETPNGGFSTCPGCGKRWLVTLMEDCFLPACGCYGDDVTSTNPARPCEPCGLRHVSNCHGKKKTKTVKPKDPLLEPIDMQELARQACGMVRR